MRSGYGDQSDEQINARDRNLPSTESPMMWSDSETKFSDDSVANVVDGSEPSEPNETALLVELCLSFEFMGDHLQQKSDVDIDWDDWILWSPEHPAAADTTWSDDETMHDDTVDISDIDRLIEASSPGLVNFSSVSSAFDFIGEYPEEDVAAESGTTRLEQNHTAPTFSAFQNNPNKN